MRGRIVNGARDGWFLNDGIAASQRDEMAANPTSVSRRYYVGIASVLSRPGQKPAGMAFDLAVHFQIGEQRRDLCRRGAKIADQLILWHG